MTGLADYLTIAATLALPGPTNTLYFLCGAALGLRGSLGLVLLALAGYGIAVAALVGLAAPLVASELRLGDVLRIAAALVLAYAAYKLWRGATRAGTSATADRQAVGNWTFFLTTLTNPKSLVFAALLLPKEDVGASAIFPLTAFLVFMIVVSGMGWLAAGAAFRSGSADGRPKTLIERLGAIVLMLFAAVLATSVVFR
ncbi:LysE family transporter [Hyphomicrobium sp.]|uniref:LysE family transporter n=1 Tax=Hyphomicrobium sp. TaxID=82 RepID=UPI0025BB3AA2|nr:LysE family transporter [Hyphomicrobium sp.]MCC7252725.1 LysE family transporter [Hyphomicrobium sp.]